MAKAFITNEPAIKMTMVGFGQAGSRMADEFAAYRTIEGIPAYNCLALNSNTGDLEGLKHIPRVNRVSLNLGGFGKNPEKAIEILQQDEKVNEKLKQFINEKVRPNDELVLFFAGLGGGTGTATIVQAIKEFYEYQNKPIIEEELKKLIASVPKEDLAKNKNRLVTQAFEKAKERFKKIGIIVTLPLRNHGPDVLRQVNEFSKQIWNLVKDPAKGIAFVTFADNQHFYDQFKKLPVNERNGVTNYRDYGNKQICEIFHELNTATKVGGADVILDERDFRRAILEHSGSLVLSKTETSIKTVDNGGSIVDLFKKSFSQNNLHEPLKLVRKTEDGKSITKKVFHVGILAVLDGTKDYDGGAFLDGAADYLHQQLPVNGTVFSGYLNTKNDFKASAYTFYKVDGLPERLEKGLVEEYEEFMKRNRKFEVEETKIESIKKEDETSLDLDLDALGLEGFFGETEKEEEIVTTDEESSEITTEDLMAVLSMSKDN